MPTTQRIKQQISIARAKTKAKDKRGALMALKTKKLFEKEIGTLQATVFTVEQQWLMLARDNVMRQEVYEDDKRRHVTKASCEVIGMILAAHPQVRIACPACGCVGGGRLYTHTARAAFEGPLFWLLFSNRREMAE